MCLSFQTFTFMGKKKGSHQDIMGWARKSITQSWKHLFFGFPFVCQK